jgi:hypothetical protein
MGFLQAHWNWTVRGMLGMCVQRQLATGAPCTSTPPSLPSLERPLQLGHTSPDQAQLLVKSAGGLLMGKPRSLTLILAALGSLQGRARCSSAGMLQLQRRDYLWCLQMHAVALKTTCMAVHNARGKSSDLNHCCPVLHAAALTSCSCSLPQPLPLPGSCVVTLLYGNTPTWRSLVSRSTSRSLARITCSACTALCLTDPSSASAARRAASACTNQHHTATGLLCP